jgi:hypothetical protein
LLMWIFERGLKTCKSEERENFEHFGSLDRRKWPFRSPNSTFSLGMQMKDCWIRQSFNSFF